MAASLYSLYVPSGFDGRAGFDVNISHIFPQGVLAAITLVGSGLEKEGLGPEPGVSQGFPSLQWPSLPYQRWGQVPSCWSRSPEGRVFLALLPLSVSPPHFQHWHPCPRGEQCWSRRACAGSWCLNGYRLWWSSHRQRLGFF